MRATPPRVDDRSSIWPKPRLGESPLVALGTAAVWCLLLLETHQRGPDHLQHLATHQQSQTSRWPCQDHSGWHTWRTDLACAPCICSSCQTWHAAPSLDMLNDHHANCADFAGFYCVTCSKTCQASVHIHAIALVYLWVTHEYAVLWRYDVSRQRCLHFNLHSQ